MASEYLSDGAKRVLAYGGEDGGPGEVPELLCFNVELSEEVSNAADRRDIIGIGSEGGSDRRVCCYDEGL